MVEITKLQKSYQGRVVLDFQEFTFKKGEKYAIIGANGSGKSTLLRLIAGVLEPDCGSVLINHGDSDRCKIAYLPQEPYAFNISVQKNVELALSKDIDRSERAKNALKLVGMESMAGSRGDRLSGGETQRMSVARILATERPLILLDEPTSATDVSKSIVIEESIRGYCRDTGCTMIFSTHSLSQAKRMADTVIMLHHGELIEYASAESFFENPQREETRAFINYWRLNS